MPQPYDALLLLSFGGPECMDDVIPFLENVTRGRNTPLARLQSVARHYELFGGVSPINEHNRKLIKSIEDELQVRGLKLPVYWGNRNWHPLVEATMADMAANNVRRALAFATSAYGSFSGCRAYLNDIEKAQSAAGDRAPVVHKLPLFYNNPLFIEANVDYLQQALNEIPAERRDGAHIVFTAHSIPQGMATACSYEAQLLETATLVCAKLQRPEFKLVFQSRSGSPAQPWLGPDICEYLKEYALTASSKDVVVQPIGFISDHMEVMYDIGVEAKAVADDLGLNLVRAATAGTHPAFVRMIVDMIVEKMNNPEPDSYQSCAVDCCPSGAPTPAAAGGSQCAK